MEQLWSRVNDHENQGRQKNTGLIGLKEGKEAGRAINILLIYCKLLGDGLGLQGSEYDIEMSR